MKNKLRRLKNYYETWRTVAMACDMTPRNLQNIRLKIKAGEPLARMAKLRIDRAYGVVRRATK